MKADKIDKTNESHAINHMSQNVVHNVLTQYFAGGFHGTQIANVACYCETLRKLNQQYLISNMAH